MLTTEGVSLAKNTSDQVLRVQMMGNCIEISHLQTFFPIWCDNCLSVHLLLNNKGIIKDAFR